MTSRMTSADFIMTTYNWLRLAYDRHRSCDKHIIIECSHATVTFLKNSKRMTSHYYVYILHLHLIKMVGKKDKKKSIKKGKPNGKGWIVNQPAEISEHYDVEEVQEGD